MLAYLHKFTSTLSIFLFFRQSAELSESTIEKLIDIFDLLHVCDDGAISQYGNKNNLPLKDLVEYVSFCSVVLYLMTSYCV